jgi:hypothetical protein
VNDPLRVNTGAAFGFGDRLSLRYCAAVTTSMEALGGARILIFDGT